MSRFWKRRSSTARYLAALVAIWAVLVPVWLLAGSQQRPPSPKNNGAQLFSTKFTAAQGLGPLFNARSCSACHGFPTAGGVGRNGLATELRVGRLNGPGSQALSGLGGPFARAHSISELGSSCRLAPGIPAGDNLSSVRNSPPLFGDGLIDSIPDHVILARVAVERRAGVDGVPNKVRTPDGSAAIGRFGWKGDVPTLRDFVGQALRNELGITSPIAPHDFVPSGARGCGGDSSRPEVGAAVVSALTAFVSSLPAPRPKTSPAGGAEVFTQSGCAVCHVPTLQSGATRVHLYSDLLLHDMGPALDDRIVEGTADGAQWRTAPLWGLHARTRYLHDGRATTLRAAILAHGGQAALARRRFLALTLRDQRLLLEFLESL